MENFKGTPGEWKSALNMELTGFRKIITNEKTICVLTATDFKTDIEFEANAKVMAASKDMLKALIEINGLCADASKTEGAKLDYSKVAKISIDVINKAL